MSDKSHFFAHLARMKLINRWPLMHNVRNENVQEHSLQVAMVAHALALIKNRLYDGQVNPDRVATIALFHDVSEVLTGDLPTPVKYYNANIASEYKKIEKIAEQKLIDMAPEALREDYAALIDSHQHNADEAFLVKAADVLCAYLKTLEELNAGNREFLLAKKRLDKLLQAYQSPEVDYFISRYVPSFSLSLDEITQDEFDGDEQADVLCAYLKTLEELNAGNREFLLAKKRLDKLLQAYQSPEVDYFISRYVPSFSLSLDEITQDEFDDDEQADVPGGPSCN